MTAIVDTIQRTLKTTPAKDNCVGPVSVPIAPTSKPSNWPWNLVRSLPGRHFHHSFFGKASYSSRKVSSTSKYRPKCDLKKKCLQCYKVYEAGNAKKNTKGGRPSKKNSYKCGWGECPFCEMQVELTSHQCFIQSVDPEDDEPKLHKVFASEVGSV